MLILSPSKAMKYSSFTLPAIELPLLLPQNPSIAKTLSATPSIGSSGSCLQMIVSDPAISILEIDQFTNSLHIQVIRSCKMKSMKLRTISIIAACFTLLSPLHAIQPITVSQETVNYREQYPTLLKDIQKKRQQLHLQYKNSTKPRAKTIQEARAYLEDTLRQEIFPAWYGTAWDFNGISQTPGKGKIACGYFVSTSLVHAGFKVNRIRLAQQPSQSIIKTFIPKKHCSVLKYQISIDKVATFLKSKGDGIYIVGLDRHVGFISVKGDQMHFIHSSYYRPSPVVVSEPIDSKNPLRDSKYRVIGKLFTDDMVIGWLTQKSYSVKRS